MEAAAALRTSSLRDVMNTWRVRPSTRTKHVLWVSAAPIAGPRRLTYLGPELRECRRHRKAQARAAASDERHLALKRLGRQHQAGLGLEGRPHMALWRSGGGGAGPGGTGSTAA